MKLGFDLDGVLCDIDVVSLNLMHRLDPDQESMAELYYYTERKPLVNPRLFMNEDDEYHIVTGRHENLREITEKWVERFCPDAKSLHIVGGQPWYYYKAANMADPEQWDNYAKNAVMSKVNKIKELELEFYIDDSVNNVKRLREELPDVTILQYGGRLK